MLMLILKILVAQLILIAAIVFILKKILDKFLVDDALTRIEALQPDSIDKDLKDVVVMTYRDLNAKTQKRISDAFYRKTNKIVPLLVQKDRNLKGGLIIKMKDNTIDCSLITRLKQSGLIR